MTTFLNTEPANIDLEFVQGDIIDMEFFINELLSSTSRKFYASLNSAPGDGSAFLMTDLNLQVRRKDSLLIKDWISGVSPSDIVISTGQFHLSDDVGFSEDGFFDYDLKCDNGIGEFTIMKGNVKVNKQITL